jgi:general L-amino acid transport system permease protein
VMITMATYLLIGLAITVLLNAFNQMTRIVER